MEKGTNTIVEYDPIAAVLDDLTKRHKGVVFDVTKPAEMKAAKAAAKDIAQYRIALEKKRVELKADVLERGRLIDGEAKRISTQLAALEDPIVEQIKAEERREQEARDAAIRAEQERLAAEEQAKKEAEEKRLAEERAKNEAEARRLADERAKLEAEDRARRAKIEEEERAAKARIAEAEEKARKERQVEEDRIRAEREKVEAVKREEEDRQRKLREAAEAKARAEREAAEAKAAAERRAKEEAERKAREKKEAAEREEKRKAAELLDAQAMLDTFVQRFGHLKQYAKVVKAIEAIKVPA